jgi:hypothetical protein
MKPLTDRLARWKRRPVNWVRPRQAGWSFDKVTDAEVRHVCGSFETAAICDTTSASDT